MAQPFQLRQILPDHRRAHNIAAQQRVVGGGVPRAVWTDEADAGTCSSMHEAGVGMHDSPIAEAAHSHVAAFVRIQCGAQQSLVKPNEVNESAVTLLRA